MRHTIRDRVITLRVSESFQRTVHDEANAESQTITAYVIDAINEKLARRRQHREKIKPNAEKGLESFEK